MVHSPPTVATQVNAWATPTMAADRRRILTMLLVFILLFYYKLVGLVGKLRLYNNGKDKDKDKDKE